MSHGRIQLEICADPIFVIGSPRSGTTVLARSLGEHSALWTANESRIFGAVLGGRLVDRVMKRADAQVGVSWLQQQGVDVCELRRHLGAGLNALHTSRSRGKRWIEHTARNTVIVDVLAETFPGAQFVHALRDGRQVVHSMVNFQGSYGVKQWRERNPSWQAPRWAGDFRFACRRWSEYVEAATGFAERRPGRCITVRHEELLADTEGCFRRLAEFLRVPYECGMSDYLRAGRGNTSFPTVYSSSDVQPPPPLSRPWEHWTADQQLVFDEEAGATFERCFGVYNETLRR